MHNHGLVQVRKHCTTPLKDLQSLFYTFSHLNLLDFYFMTLGQQWFLKFYFTGEHMVFKPYFTKTKQSKSKGSNTPSLD